MVSKLGAKDDSVSSRELYVLNYLGTKDCK
jgi:hypothetical protein